jgi:phosphatidylserine/phosphatidylglycerophosphate/cardiolipin synthase-like enzyme
LYIFSFCSNKKTNLQLMKISNFTINELVPFINGDENHPRRSGPQLVTLFNKFGARDVYDETGLPDIGKKNGHRPSRSEYTKNRVESLVNTNELRELLQSVFDELENKADSLDKLNKILNHEGFGVHIKNGQLLLQGGIILKSKPVVNEAHFQDIQNRILHVLDEAKVSIRVVMAWFTNDLLFAKLIEKHNQGIDVKVAIYDDGINRKHGIDISKIPHDLIKRGMRGGLMHDKFCVVDNQIVLTGSYNWTNNAEFRNDENITIEKDPEQASKFSQEYARLTK